MHLTDGGISGAKGIALDLSINQVLPLSVLGSVFVHTDENFEF